MQKYTNRYRDEFWYEPVEGEPKKFKLCGELNYWRYGGKEGQEQIDMSDLGFADPSGGPFFECGQKFAIGVIKKISLVGEDLILEVV